MPKSDLSDIPNLEDKIIFRYTGCTLQTFVKHYDSSISPPFLSEIYTLVVLESLKKRRRDNGNIILYNGLKGAKYRNSFKSGMLNYPDKDYHCCYMYYYYYYCCCCCCCYSSRRYYFIK